MGLPGYNVVLLFFLDIFGQPCHRYVYAVSETDFVLATASLGNYFFY